MGKGGRSVVLLGAAGLVIGALLPWVKIASIFGTITKAGYEGDGMFTGGIGLLLLIGALLLKGKPGKMYSVASSIFAVIAGLISGYDWLNVASTLAEANENEMLMASVGAGLYLTLIGALLAFIGGFMRIPAPPEPPSPPPGPPAPESLQTTET